MFDIKFRIVDDLEYLENVSAQKFDYDGADIEGFFQLNFDGNIEGHYKEGNLNRFEVGHELITLWFDLLIEVILILKRKSNYVALKEIESIDSWFEFTLIDEILYVSYANCIEKNSELFIITSKKECFLYQTWKEISIPFNEFRDKVKMKAKQYINEIENINPKLLDTKIISKLYRKLESI